MQSPLPHWRNLPQNNTTLYHNDVLPLIKQPTHSLRSHGIINPAVFELVKSSKETKCKEPAVWTTDEESALLDFLFSELPKIRNGNFKMTKTIIGQ
ncbi:hypothetical protein PAXRUDRAFT_155580 [Paxillus rubicundulus Ve08.2h10]|uniref:Uncharacterized protein n=1 Tax=Paxillus rubicundulus Ve08.2h10 TaxID=930991 RepID=A0A0D0D0V6_9AGAM|nr:hypothetical protein PAXRUDRAFT_155580 [Paxillus rubicundulus Ve08.2h10]